MGIKKLMKLVVKKIKDIKTLNRDQKKQRNKAEDSRII